MEIGGKTETMVSACSETHPISPVKDKVDLDMAELECEFKRYLDKASTTSQLYLNLLITSYLDQIATLKEELKETSAPHPRTPWRIVKYTNFQTQENT